MSKLWDGEPETGPTAGEIKSADDAKSFLEKQRKPLRAMADRLARELDDSDGSPIGAARRKA